MYFTVLKVRVYTVQITLICVSLDQLHCLKLPDTQNNLNLLFDEVMHSIQKFRFNFELKNSMSETREEFLSKLPLESNEISREQIL